MVAPWAPGDISTWLKRGHLYVAATRARRLTCVEGRPSWYNPPGYGPTYLNYVCQEGGRR